MLDDLKPSTRLKLYATISGLLSYVHGFAAAALAKYDLVGFALFASVAAAVAGIFCFVSLIASAECVVEDSAWKRERDREDGRG